MTVQLLVIAKAPAPGRTKTRLTPPCTPTEAAALAEAALVDTLAAVARAPATRRVLVLDGEPGGWLPDGFEVIAQRGRGLDERLAAAFEDAGAPSLLVGMDTPQITAELLAECGHALIGPGVDAVLGRASDGGWWTIGLREPDAQAFLSVPMSTDHTWQAQRDRLEARGLHVVDVPELRDVDRFADAEAVAASIPGSSFAATMAEVASAVRSRGADL